MGVAGDQQRGRRQQADARPSAAQALPIGVLVLLTVATLLLTGVVVAHASARRVPRPPAASTRPSSASPAASAGAAPRASVRAPTAAARVPAPHLVVLGDSVPAAAACQCAGFGAELARTLTATLTNSAVSGQNSAGLIQQLNDPAVRAAVRTASVVTVTIGANDFDETKATDRACMDLSCYSSTMNVLSGHITTILQKIRALLPAGGIVVVTGYWNVFLDGQVAASLGPTYVAVSNALTVAVNDALLAASSLSAARYTDLYQPFKSVGNPDDTQFLAADGDHPNAAGHQLIATAIHATLAN